jgi:hypothetical protein
MLNVEEERDGLKYVKEISLSGGRMVRLQTWMNIASALLICAMIAGCGSDKLHDPYPQTRILRVDVLPNPVIVGDTVTFKCVIADSLDERFEFKWFIDGESGPIVTSDPILKWKAELPSGDYIFSVRADNGESERRSVGTSFNVQIE